jgi:hypothetical protein
MAITQALCTSFKEELMLGDHDLDTDSLKIALYTSSASLDATTTAYTTDDEVTGTNYSAGGVALNNASVTVDGTTAILDFDDAVFANVSITARGAVIYNTSSAINTNAAIAVLDFGADKTATDGDFTVIFPAAAASTAIVRIA